MAKCYIEIKDKKILTYIRNYRKSKNIKFFFRGTVLNISKPTRLKFNKLIDLLKDYENEIYNQYVDILSTDNTSIKHWINNEKILYGGEEFTIFRKKSENKRINLNLDLSNKTLEIYVPLNLNNEEEIKKIVDKKIKKLLQNSTENIIEKRLPCWSVLTKINYKSFKVRDTISKYGSCKPITRELYFSARLAMLSQDKIDAIIVHELCHISCPNHSKEFYSLVKKYIPNYDEIDEWLKKNNKNITI